MTDAIVAEGLVKRYKDVTALDGHRPAGPGGKRAGAARPQRRRQDHRGADPDHPARSRRGPGRGGRLSTWPHDPRGVRRTIGLSGQYAAVDEYLTGFENLEMIGRLYHLGRRASAARARELLAQFGLEDAADRPVEDLLRRHAATARPRRRAGRRAHPCCSSTSRRPASTPAAGPRCGSLIQELVVGRHHPAADHPVPRGGRPAGRRHRRDRPRQGDRPRHRRRAEVPGRRRAPGGHGRRATADVVPRPGAARRRSPPARSTFDEGRRSLVVPGRPAVPRVLADALRRLDGAGSGSTTSACAGPPWTTSS